MSLPVEGVLPMTVFFRSIARTFVSATIAFGVTPPAVSLFELLQTPRVQIVAMVKRRRADYAALFGADEGTR